MNNSEQTMLDEKQFVEAMKECEWRYSHYGNRASERAYEYGVLAVKNCFLVAGGGLFFVPTMVGLSADVNLTSAVFAGVSFAVAVLFSLLTNYVIHWNWALHERVWMLRYDLERLQVRGAYGRAYASDAQSDPSLQLGILKNNTWINRTFLVPHIFAVIIVVSLGLGAVFLYRAFGISGAVL